MKANEFVKKFGWEKAKELIEFHERCGSLTCDCDFNVNDLKRLVESHELVEKVGGLDKARMLLNMRIAAELYDSAGEIEKAINDVESCL